MILAVDIGNSVIELGAYDGDELLFVTRIVTEVNKTEAEYAVLLREIIRLHRQDETTLTGAILSSVVPALTMRLRKAVTLIAPVRVLQIGPGIKTGLNIRIDNPAQLGADFVAAAIGAMEKYPLPAVVIELGTATKFSLIDKNRTFVGGSIMPGVTVGLEALSNRAAQLPHIGLENEIALIGTNTEDCMKSGVVFGAASMIDGMLDRYAEKAGSAASVIACGEWVDTIIPRCRHNIMIDPTLLLDGLYAVYRRNSELR